MTGESIQGEEGGKESHKGSISVRPESRIRGEIAAHPASLAQLRFVANGMCDGLHGLDIRIHEGLIAAIITHSHPHTKLVVGLIGVGMEGCALR